MQTIWHHYTYNNQLIMILGYLLERRILDISVYSVFHPVMRTDKNAMQCDAQQKPSLYSQPQTLTELAKSSVAALC